MYLDELTGGAVTVIDLTSAADPSLMFNRSRLIEPTGYTNATAALFAAAVWPALFLASRRETPWPVRGVFMASAGLLTQLALIPQSRGTFIVFPIVLVLFTGIGPLLAWRRVSAGALGRLFALGRALRCSAPSLLPQDEG